MHFSSPLINFSLPETLPCLTGWWHQPRPAIFPTPLWSPPSTYLNAARLMMSNATTLLGAVTAPCSR